MSPFTAVPDKNAGDIYDEVMWDTYLKDNLNFIASQVAVYDEVSYAEFTTQPIPVTVSTEATAVSLVSSGSLTYTAGDIIWISFFCPRTQGNSDINFWLFDAAVSIGKICQSGNGNSSSVFGRRRLTPSAGSHSYSIRASRVSANSNVYAGPGGSGTTDPPGWMRIVKALG